MASRQAKEERGEQAARYAADQIRQAREQAAAEEHQHGYGHQPQEQRPGVIGSVMKAVQGTYGQVVGKTQDAGDAMEDAARRHREREENTAYTQSQTGQSLSGKAGEYKDYTVDKATQAKDATVDKARQAKDATMEKAAQARDATADKAKQAKDATADKAGEYRDYAADKARDAKDATVEGKDTTVGKLTEMKDRAMGFLTGKKDEAQEKAGEAADATRQKAAEARDTVKDRAAEARDRTARAGQAAKGNLQREAEESRERVEGLRMEDEAARRSRAERGEERTGIFGAIKNVAGTLKDNVTGGGEHEAAGRRGGSEEVVTVSVEETRPGMAADLLKAADQMSGQTFNDPGKMGGEGTGYRTRRRD